MIGERPTVDNGLPGSPTPATSLFRLSTFGFRLYPHTLPPRRLCRALSARQRSMLNERYYGNGKVESRKRGGNADCRRQTVDCRLQTEDGTRLQTGDGDYRSASRTSFGVITVRPDGDLPAVSVHSAITIFRPPANGNVFANRSSLDASRARSASLQPHFTSPSNRLPRSSDSATTSSSTGRWFSSCPHHLEAMFHCCPPICRLGTDSLARSSQMAAVCASSPSVACSRTASVRPSSSRDL